MANIKVSEMTEATSFDDGDYTMIIQGNASKKISKENMLNGVEEEIGDLTSLATTDKTDLVSATNENTTKITNITGQILWTNPNPTSNFGVQTITLNSSDYDMYEILFTPNLTGSDAQRLLSSGKIVKGYGTRLSMSFAGSTSPGANVFSKIVSYNTDTKLDFDIGYVAYGTTARWEVDTIIVPQYIIGYKTGLFS